MAGKFKGRYRITSSRARWWDYGNNGSYFVTVCTINKVHYFGEIEDGVMHRSVLGHIDQAIWGEIPKRFPYAGIGEFVVMPNHIHGIVTIDKPRSDHVDSNVETRLIASLHSNPHDPTNPHDPKNPSAYQPDDQQPNEFEAVNKTNSRAGGITGMHNPMLHQNLSRVMRWFTGRVTYEIHKIDLEFNWQRRFYDHIVRNRYERSRKARYIIRNPLNWKEDRFFTK